MDEDFCDMSKETIIEDASGVMAGKSYLSLPRSLVVCVVVLVCSVFLSLVFQRIGLASNGANALGYFATFNLFVAQDTWAGPLTAAVIMAAWYWASRGRALDLAATKAPILVLALGAAALSLILRFVVHQNYGLSIDEFMPTFQAEIFRGGHLMAPLSEANFAIRENLQPFFIYSDEEHLLWTAHYRPVHAAIISIFPRGVDVAFAHAILTGITVLAIADIAKRLFPDRAGAPYVAILLLIGSPQVLLTSASGFSFTTHLALNTVWLALFLRGTWIAHIAAAIVGFFALGIHQVHVHAIYVFPFGIAMLAGYFGNRWMCLPYVVSYAIGVPMWIMWPEIATFIQTGDVTALPRTLLEVEYLSNYINYSEEAGSLDRQFSVMFLAVNLMRFLLWLSPAVALLLVIAIYAGRKLGPVVVISTVGFLFTVVMSHLMLPNQMHTIGSRYYHPAFANIVIIALAAYYSQFEWRQMRLAVTSLAVIGLVGFLPWRAYQIHEKVAPRAAVQAQLNALDADRVVIRPGGVWFMPDFVRNDPYLTKKGPVFYYERGDEPAPEFDGTSVTITAAELIEMGLPRGTFLEPAFELGVR